MRRCKYTGLFLSPTSALAPLLQAQGIPHIKRLSAAGFKMGLLTWENRECDVEKSQLATDMKRDLASHGIEWQCLLNRRIPVVPSATVNIILNAFSAYKILRKGQFNFVHCRSYLSAYLMLMLRWLIQIPFIFDMRGFLPEEYVLAEHWTKKCWKYRLAKYLEWKCLNHAAAVITTNSGMQENLFAQLEARGRETRLLEKKTYIIENCADISLFRPSRTERDETRKMLGLTHELVVVWSCGQIATWHLPEQTLAFFKCLRQRVPTAKLLVLTKSTHLTELCEEAGVAREDVIFKSVEHDNVPEYLNAADVGIVFVSPKTSTFPVKVAEYLACGLPVILDKGVDRNIPLSRQGVGILVEEYNQISYFKAIEATIELLATGANVGDTCRDIAEKCYSLDAAVDKYMAIYQGICRGN